MGKSMGVVEFKAACLRIIKQMGQDGEPVSITNRGKPVAVQSPAPTPTRSSLLGALRGSVLKYNDPCLPAANPSDWNAAR